MILDFIIIINIYANLFKLSKTIFLNNRNVKIKIVITFSY